MPTREWDLKGEGYVWDDEDLVLSQGSAYLRRKDADGNYHPSGHVESSAELILPVWEPGALTQLTGAELDADFTLGGQIEFQLSINGGTSYLYWDGSSWEAATSSDWNDILDINVGLPSLTFDPDHGRKITIKIRLSSSDDETPTLQKLSFHYEAEFDFEDDIKLSLKSYIEERTQVRIRYAQVLDSDSDELDVETDFEIVGAIGVYNLDDDPHKVVNLFSARVGNKLLLTASQVVGSTLEALLLCRAPVFIAVDEDYQLSENPAVVLSNPSLVELVELRSGDRKLEVNLSSKDVRERLQPVWIEAEVNAVCQAKKEHEALAMSQDLARLFQFQRPVPSKALGESLQVTGFIPVEDMKIMGTGVHTKTTSFRISGRYWLDEPTVKKLAEEVVITARPMRVVVVNDTADPQGD